MKSNINNKVKVVFYLNSDDKIYIQNHCDLLQIKPSFFIRNAVLEKLGKTTFTETVKNLDTKKYLATLNNIGSNLNQIAKKLNSNAQFLIADQQTVLKEIKSINEHIVEINSKI
jgi:hypothetical protein